MYIFVQKLHENQTWHFFHGFIGYSYPKMGFPKVDQNKSSLHT